MVKYFSAVLLMIFFIQGCKKDDIKKEAGLLSKAVADNRTMLYSYDDNDRLISIEEIYSTGKILYSVVFDSQGRVTRSEKKRDGVVAHFYSYVYNDRGLIIKKIGTTLDPLDYAYDRAYGYDIKGRVIVDTCFYRQTTALSWISDFKYDANNNVSEIYFRDFVNVSNSGLTTNIYDAKPNPLYLQGSIYHIIFENSNYLSPNNLIEFDTWWTNPIKIKIEYNASGLPASKQTIITGGQTFPAEKYEYR